MDAPIRDGLFPWPADPRRPRLYAGRCVGCGRLFFPVRAACGACGRVGLDRVEVGPRGTLHTFTVCHSGAPGLEVPYAVGYVDLPEGLRVFAPLAGGELFLGAPMELEIVPYRRWGDVTRHAYRFRLVE